MYRVCADCGHEGGVQCVTSCDCVTGRSSVRLYVLQLCTYGTVLYVRYCKCVCTYGAVLYVRYCTGKCVRTVLYYTCGTVSVYVQYLSSWASSVGATPFFFPGLK